MCLIRFFDETIVQDLVTATQEENEEKGRGEGLPFNTKIVAHHLGVNFAVNSTNFVALRRE